MSDQTLFPGLSIIGGFLPPDMVQKLASDNKISAASQRNKSDDPYHLNPETFGLHKDKRLDQVTLQAWDNLQLHWRDFDGFRTTEKSLNKWLLPLFDQLGYGALNRATPLVIDDKSYPISHGHGPVPIHLVPYNTNLDVRVDRVGSPHGMTQEFLNRSKGHQFALISNGLTLRILRDNPRLTRASYLEFDLLTIFSSRCFATFDLLFRLAHATRFRPGDPAPDSDQAADCIFESWIKKSGDEVVRARETLRLGVEQAIQSLGSGFLADRELLRKYKSGELTKTQIHHQLLRLVYRILFLLVAEDRGALHPPTAKPETRELYRHYYSLSRIRALSREIKGNVGHFDLFESFQITLAALGKPDGLPALGLPSLGGLFDPGNMPDLNNARCPNFSFLEAMRALCTKLENNMRRLVDFNRLGSEEFGSVYESLLELLPVIQLTDHGAHYTIETLAGNERKTQGSYYTPACLIDSLLETALLPVIQAAINDGPAPTAPDRLLALRICDPACGSGHFLIGAARMVAKHLASLRVGDEPSDAEQRHALREVVSRCIYGVDLDPDAIELAKIALWMEALEPGKPLSFLDQHLQVGNSLLGTTPNLILKGLPDDAFDPIAGDDKKHSSLFKKQNREQWQQYQGKGDLFEEAELGFHLGDMASGYKDLNTMADDTPEQMEAIAAAYARLKGEGQYRPSGHLLADAWTAAFVWRKDKGMEHAITVSLLQRIRKNPHDLAPWMFEEIQRLAKQYQFFHWHLAFPEVMNRGGFDCILANPPWERVKLQEKEWFAQRHPRIANAANAAARTRMIESLKIEDPKLFADFQEDLRKAGGESHLLRSSGLFPLCGRGDINVYTVFAELMRTVVHEQGRVGAVLPSGIATDDTTKFFFRDLMEKKALASLFDFENRKALFPGVHRSTKFCLITMGNGVKFLAQEATFVFFALNTNELNDPDKRFTLSSEDIALLNPNTRNCPIFRSGRDAELTKAIYRRVPVLIKEARDGQPEENPWGIKFSTMFHMSNDSHLFRTREQLEEEHWELQGNIFRKAGEEYLPLYEAKMIHHYDHRWATYDGLDTRDFTLEEKQNPNRFVMGRYWVKDSDVQDALKNTGWNKKWLMGWRDITNTTNERTVIGGIFSKSAVGNKLPLMISSKMIKVPFIMINSVMGSLVFDFSSRQKIGGTTINFFLMKQFPVIAPSFFEITEWRTSKYFNIVSIVIGWLLELTYTAWDLEPFAQDCNYHGPPFKWNEDRRFQIRCELDAAFFHLYLPSTKEGNWKPSLISEGNVKDETEAEFHSLKHAFPTPRHAVEHILESFPIVKRKDEAAFGEYRTKRVILEIYDAMQDAMVTGQPYQSPLDPPAGPPEDPLPEWKSGKPQPEGWPSHIHPPRGLASAENKR